MPVDTVWKSIYLIFSETQTETKTKRYLVTSVGGAILGTIKFRPQWRRFVFEPHSGTVFDRKCLTDLCDFLERQDQDWRRSLE